MPQTHRMNLRSFHTAMGFDRVRISNEESFKVSDISGSWKEITGEHKEIANQSPP
jgi:hypothetical protein